MKAETCSRCNNAMGTTLRYVGKDEKPYCSMDCLGAAQHEAPPMPPGPESPETFVHYRSDSGRPGKARPNGQSISERNATAPGSTAPGILAPYQDSTAQGVGATTKKKKNHKDIDSTGSAGGALHVISIGGVGPTLG